MNLFGTHKGFSIIELLVAIAVLGLGLFSLLSVLTASIQANAKSTNLSSALDLASSELERTIQGATKDLPAGSKEAFWTQDFPPSGPPLKQYEEKVGGTKFLVEVFNQTIAGTGNNRIKKLTVLVFWWNSEKKGYGKLQTSATRLVAEP